MTLVDARMRVSQFDLVTSFFTALIWFIGVVVSVLFVLWCLSKVAESTQSNPPVRMRVLGATSDGGEPEFVVPDGPEVEQLTNPDLAMVVAQIDAASTQMAGRPLAGNGRPAESTGDEGDPRTPGVLDGVDIVPKFERWQLNFSAKSQNAYARQLDGLGIELGAFGGGRSQLDYASHLSTNPAVRHSSKPESETRLYFSWQHATPLSTYERNLLGNAGIPTSGRNVVKFISSDLEAELDALEIAYASKNGVDSISQIAKTIFEVRSRGDQFQFVVISQRYRNQIRITN